MGTDESTMRRVFRKFHAPGSGMRQLADWMVRGPLNPPPIVKAAVDANQQITADALRDMDQEQRMRLAQDG
jgi:hypothetical protein